MSEKQTEARNELLNMIAEKTGIDATTTEGRNTCRDILVSILMEEKGMSAEEAFNTVWGEGFFKQLVDSVYDELTAA